jgi:ketosteroid isomerase-like protein
MRDAASRIGHSPGQRAHGSRREMIEGTLAENNRRFADAAARCDARAMASVYANDADFLPPNTEALRGRAAIERFWDDGIEMGIRSLGVETLRLDQADGLAYEIGRYTLCFGPVGGTPVTDLATYLVTHRRGHDGCWRRTAEIFTWDAPLPGE